MRIDDRVTWNLIISWSLGTTENDETKMMPSGIYKISRSPAFLEVYLLYLG
ncbi:hypothetical protein [Streptococcus ratti]|uniref:hypothetical protein n=1 Tax=Streptococcus ratti TaxID=1341 RepID=UPI0018772D6A|nr:hypothetical protein [Streptococcus ratti]